MLGHLSGDGGTENKLASATSMISVGREDARGVPGGNRAAGQARQPRPALTRDAPEWRDRQSVVQFVKGTSGEPGGGESGTRVRRRTDRQGGGVP